MTLDDLKEYLDSDANKNGLDSIATHGFLMATLVGKPLPNWMSLLFDGQDDQVSDDVKRAIESWRNSLFDKLKSEEGVELPLEANEDSNDDSSEVDFSFESDLTAWSIGFVDAMYGDEHTDWFDDEDTAEDVAMLTLPMMVFSGIDTIDADGQNSEDEDLAEIRRDEDALAQMANSIEGNLSELFLLFNTED